MLRRLLLCFTLLPTLAFGAGFDFRVGMVAYPNADYLFSIDGSAVFSLSEEVSLGIGAALRTNFDVAGNPAALVRLKYRLSRVIDVGAVGEFGYLFNTTFSGPNTYTYVFAGPLIGINLKPLFLLWEPGAIFYQNQVGFVPLRIMISIF